MEKNNIGLKRVAVGAIGLLNNEPGSHFRGGADALGPEVALFLTKYISSKKHIISQRCISIIKMMPNFGKIHPSAIQTFLPRCRGQKQTKNI